MTTVDLDCGTCSVRGRACADCVVTVLLGPPGELRLEQEEQAALAALAGAGLVPPLRLVRADEGSEPQMLWREPREAESRQRRQG